MLQTLIRVGQIQLRFYSRGGTLTSDSGRYKKSRMKLWPKFRAAFNQIQFADQDFKSNSMGKPAKSRRSLSWRLLKSPTLSPCKEEKNLAKMCQWGGGGEIGSVFCLVSLHSCASHSTTQSQITPHKSVTLFFLFLPSHPPQQKSVITYNRPRVFQTNGGSQVDGLQKLRHRGAK